MSLVEKIFSVNTDTQFSALALDIFRHQVENNKVYGEYVKAIGKKAAEVKRIEDIPFLPVSFFKTHDVVCGKDGKYDTIFTSSTTSGDNPSRHLVRDIEIYKESFRKGFSHFYGDIKDYCVLALLPSYLERSGSSLVFMAEDMVTNSNNKLSGFYIHNYNELAEKLALLEKQGKKVLLLGVTYALLKLAEEYPMHLKHTVIMETGGMKGKRQELPKQEVHQILKKAFGVEHIHSEYGMTELLSQGYSKGDGVFNCPPWMRILVRDMYDPLNVGLKNTSGAINIIDLANINSCSFVATDDVGIVHENGSFEVSGRIDYSDIRGCNLMADDIL
jgi:phenylacetate-coenzyme A ligase PaaK-like adenylate-forming protein